MSKSKIAARLTMTKRSGRKTIMEVHEDAGWSTFYSWYEQDGRRKKVFLRHSDRNNCGNPYRQEPGLEQVAAKQKEIFDNLARHPNPKHAAFWAMQQIVEIRIKVFKKRLYRKLLTCAPDELPGRMVKDLSADRPERMLLWDRSVPMPIRDEDVAMKCRLDRVFADKIG